MKRIMIILGMRMRPIMLWILRLFFDKQYLRGRYFESSVTGFAWGFRTIWQRNILRLARPMPFPVGLTCQIARADAIEFHPDDLNNLQASGTYYQNALGRITLGRGCYIAPNVGLITANHDPQNLDDHQQASDIRLGDKCWIGMNSVILPGVELGPSTIVAAGAVVTKSFLQGNCVIAGVPAKQIKTLSPPPASNGPPAISEGQ